MNSKENKNVGFEYYVEEDRIIEYSKWSSEDKLRWLSEWNKLREYYPKDIIEKQDKLRCKDNY